MHTAQMLRNVMPQFGEVEKHLDLIADAGLEKDSVGVCINALNIFDFNEGYLSNSIDIELNSDGALNCAPLWWYLLASWQNKHKSNFKSGTMHLLQHETITYVHRVINRATDPSLASSATWAIENLKSEPKDDDPIFAENLRLLLHPSNLNQSTFDWVQILKSYTRKVSETRTTSDNLSSYKHTPNQIECAHAIMCGLLGPRTAVTAILNALMDIKNEDNINPLNLHDFIMQSSSRDMLGIGGFFLQWLHNDSWDEKHKTLALAHLIHYWYFGSAAPEYFSFKFNVDAHTVAEICGVGVASLYIPDDNNEFLAIRASAATTQEEIFNVSILKELHENFLTMSSEEFLTRRAKVFAEHAAKIKAAAEPKTEISGLYQQINLENIDSIQFDGGYDEHDVKFNYNEPEIELELGAFDSSTEGDEALSHSAKVKKLIRRFESNQQIELGGNPGDTYRILVDDTVSEEVFKDALDVMASRIVGRIQNMPSAENISFPQDEPKDKAAHDSNSEMLQWAILDPKSLKEAHHQFLQLTREKEGSSENKKLAKWLLKLASKNGMLPLQPIENDSIKKLEALAVRYPNAEKAVSRVIDAFNFSRLSNAPYAKMPPLLLEGDPGIGKTTLCMEMTSAILGEDHVRKIDVSSVSASWVLTGSSTQWKDARPGIIVQTLLADDAIANSAFILDEIDKSGQGNYPVDNVLLSLLEPQTSKCFQDEFLGLPLDIRPTSWLATCNDAKLLAKHLLSRMLWLKIPSPNALQMRQIIQNIWLDSTSSLRDRDIKILPKLAPSWLFETKTEDLRQFRRRLDAALGKACSRHKRGRLRLTPQDFFAASQTESTNKIGFN